MKIFILAAFLSLAAQVPAVPMYGDLCRYGPTYWCRSLQAATSCSAFTHCLQTVWQPQIVDVRQTDQCLASEESVSLARRARSVDGKIQGTLITSICDNAGDETTKQQCHDTVSEFLPQVLSLLESSMEPSSVAVLLGLCELYEDEPTVETEHSVSSETTLCQDCHSFLQKTKELLKRSQAEEELVTVAESGICSHFGDLEIWCKATMELGLPHLFKFLEENDGAELLCGLSSICEDAEEPKLKKNYLSDLVGQAARAIEMDTDSEVICHDCEKVLTSALAFGKESSARKSVEHAIAHLCSLTSLTEERCLLLSEGFSRIPEDLLQEIAMDVNVPKVCRSVIGCSGSERAQEEEEEEEEHSPEEIHTLGAADPISLAQVPQTPRCEECLHVFDGVRQVLKSEKTVSQARVQAKHSLCGNADSMEDQCGTIVGVFLPMVADWLTTIDSASLVCSRLAQCPKSEEAKTLDFVKLFGTTWQQSSLAQLGSFECDTCMVLVEDARAADRDPDVQKAVVDFFDSICDDLGQEAAQCKALVEQYAPDLFEIIASELDPTVVCELLLKCTKPEMTRNNKEDISAPQTRPEQDPIGQELSDDESEALRRFESDVEENHLMKKAEKVAEEVVNKVEDNSLMCTVCDMLMEKVDNAIANNKTEAKVDQALGEVCGLLPSDDQEACRQIVDTFSPVIVHLVLQQLDPHLICTELHLCTDTAPRTPRAPEEAEEKTIMEEEDTEDRQVGLEEEEEEKEKEEVPEQTNQCDLCQRVVFALDQVIAQNKTQVALQKALDEVCPRMPEQMQDRCLGFVDQYSGALVELILQELFPEKFCFDLHLCQQDRGPVQKAVNVALPEISAKPAPKTVTVKKENNSHNRKQSPSSGGVADGEACLLCQTLANFVKEALNEQSTQDELEKLMKDVCTRLPANLTATCDMIVDQFTPLILQLLAEKDNPLELCQAVKLCPAGAHEGRMPLGGGWEDEAPNEARVEDMAVLGDAGVSDDEGMLGEDSCTYGPSYWCASMDNARQCGMVRECIEKYGLKP